jgi:hypothetical protein
MTEDSSDKKEEIKKSHIVRRVTGILQRREKELEKEKVAQARNEATFSEESKEQIASKVRGDLDQFLHKHEADVEGKDNIKPDDSKLLVVGSTMHQTSGVYQQLFKLMSIVDRIELTEAGKKLKAPKKLLYRAIKELVKEKFIIIKRTISGKIILESTEKLKKYAGAKRT